MCQLFFSSFEKENGCFAHITIRGRMQSSPVMTRLDAKLATTRLYTSKLCAIQHQERNGRSSHYPKTESCDQRSSLTHCRGDLLFISSQSSKEPHVELTYIVAFPPKKTSQAKIWFLTEFVAIQQPPLQLKARSQKAFAN